MTMSPQIANKLLVLIKKSNVLIGLILTLRFGGVTDWYQSQGYREPAVMSSASSVVTYTFVYTDSEPRRVFWGADEEISNRGSRRVIVLGYNGLPMHPVAPPSPDYIPGFEEPQTPLVPRDEEDEHVFLVEEQPLPPVDSPTAESPGYVVESDLEEDPEEYEDDETEDGPVDYPIDRGEDGDDDDGDSSGDDADDEDEEDEDKGDEDEEEHLASANSAVVVPTIEPVSPPEGIEHVIPPPSTDIVTTGARITIRLQASISLPPDAEVERLLAMPTPSLSPPISLSPPSVGECLARYTAPSAHSSPPPIPSPLLPSFRCPTQTQTLRIASTQALIDAVTAALSSPPLLPLPPSIYIPLPIDCRDDVLESELPPRKRLCLSTLGPSKVGYGIRDTWVDPPEAVPEIALMTLGEVYAHEFQLHAHQTQLQFQGTLIQIQHQVHETRFQMQQAEMAELRETNLRRQAKLLALRGQHRRARQPGSDAGAPDH
ncbi:hypothetical protein Tco_0375257 [Tanacetum coccineum]